MIIVSCRNEFGSDWRFAEQNEFREYTTSDPARFALLDPAELPERVDGRHVLVLVHGYRNPLKNVLAAYLEMEKSLVTNGLLVEQGESLRTQYGLVIGFAWPGYRTRSLGFLAARPSANRSGSYLRSLIETLRHSARTIDIQTHSLGARVALQALCTTDSLWVDNLMLTAPAVDNECLQPQEEFNEALDSCNRLFVYHSHRDPVLKTYVAASFDRALGSKGPQDKAIIQASCPNVRVVDCRAEVAAHSDYRKSKLYYQHWTKVLAQEPLPQYGSL